MDELRLTVWIKPKLALDLKDPTSKVKKTEVSDFEVWLRGDIVEGPGFNVPPTMHFLLKSIFMHFLFYRFHHYWQLPPGPLFTLWSHTSNFEISVIFTWEVGSYITVRCKFGVVQHNQRRFDYPDLMKPSPNTPKEIPTSSSVPTAVRILKAYIKILIFFYPPNFNFGKVATSRYNFCIRSLGGSFSAVRGRRAVLYSKLSQRPGIRPFPHPFPRPACDILAP